MIPKVWESPDRKGDILMAARERREDR